MSLSGLAVDAITLITSKIDGIDIVRLILSGDLLIRLKLSLGVHDFDFLFSGVGFVPLTQVVKLISQYLPSIEHFKVSNDEDWELARSIGPVDLNLLPSTLKSL